MTRINAFIPPAELSDKHLLAEHREIKRIPNMVRSGKAKLEDIPDKFTLGKGHVKFFYNKLKWLQLRYQDLYEEAVFRGFKVTHFGDAFTHSFEDNIGYMLWLKVYKRWEPNESEIERIQELIRQRIIDNENKPKKCPKCKEKDTFEKLRNFRHCGNCGHSEFK
jgi:hypothetical protein